MKNSSTKKKTILYILILLLAELAILTPWHISFSLFMYTGDMPCYIQGTHFFEDEWPNIIMNTILPPICLVLSRFFISWLCLYKKESFHHPAPWFIAAGFYTAMSLLGYATYFVILGIEDWTRICISRGIFPFVMFGVLFPLYKRGIDEYKKRKAARNLAKLTESIYD